MTRRSLPFGVLAVVYLLVVGLLTLGPTLWRTRPASGDYDVLSLSTWLDPDTWVRIGSPEFVANILLFVPLGLLLRLAIPRGTWFGATVFGGIVSVSIEVLQVWTPRVSDPRDIVANTLGALAGALLGSVIGFLASARVGGSPSEVRPRAASHPAASRPAGRPGAG
jgi:glycopeptide antibiotics resistance protein